MFIYVFKSQAVRDIKKLSKEVQKRILKKLDFFVALGNPLVFADHLISYDIGQYRFRIGDYRVIFDFEDRTIVILTVGHRREIYK